MHSLTVNYPIPVIQFFSGRSFPSIGLRTASTSQKSFSVARTAILTECRFSIRFRLAGHLCLVELSTALEVYTLGGYLTRNPAFGSFPTRTILPIAIYVSVTVR